MNNVDLDRLGCLRKEYRFLDATDEIESLEGIERGRSV